MLWLKCTKFYFCWSSIAPDHAGGAYSPDLLAVFKGPTSKGEKRGRGDGKGRGKRRGGKEGEKKGQVELPYLFNPTLTTDDIQNVCRRIREIRTMSSQISILTTTRQE